MKIKILEHGPYIVSPDIPLHLEKITIDAEGTSQGWQITKTYPAHKEAYALCRCGRSKIKPFCDGTHEEINFDGEEVATHDTDYDSIVEYHGDTVKLEDEESLCGVLRFCDRGIQVWGYVEEGGEENAKIAIEEACNCATGRLRIIGKDGKVIEPQLNKEISAIQDTATNHRGPLWIKGGIEIEGADGKLYKVRNRVTLCRCGESSNMPFCDATHLQCPHMKGNDQ